MIFKFQMRVGFGVLIGAASLLATTSARAALVATPFGPMDQECVHEVPMGAAVDVATGNVKVNGQVVAHYGPLI